MEEKNKRYVEDAIEAGEAPFRKKMSENEIIDHIMSAEPRKLSKAEERDVLEFIWEFSFGWGKIKT